MTTESQVLSIRALETGDLDRVVEIDALHTGERKRRYWQRVLSAFLSAEDAERRVGLAAFDGERLMGYLLGEVRAFEFGSEPCGWIFAVGVDTELARTGVASALLREACSRFRERGVGTVRTMVRRSDIPVLSFFRSNGFVGGAFYQLELDLGELE